MLLIGFLSLLEEVMLILATQESVIMTTLERFHAVNVILVRRTTWTISEV